MLDIQNLSVHFEDKELLHNITLHVDKGARHLLAGQNGSGKSTLVAAISGTPGYTITSGKIMFNGTDITNESTTFRALHGIFIGTQNVPEIPGLTILSLLKHSCSAFAHFKTGKDLSMAEFLEKLEQARTQLDIPREWLNRSVNVGFSGGERNRIMLLRLLLLNPTMAILDEPDSGTDVKTQRLIADTIKQMTDTTFLFISHQPNFTDMIVPTAITTISDGKII